MILESIGTDGGRDSVDEILFFQSNCCDYFNDCDSTLLGRRETKCRFVKNSLEDPFQLQELYQYYHFNFLERLLDTNFCETLNCINGITCRKIAKKKNSCKLLNTTVWDLNRSWMIKSKRDFSLWYIVAKEKYKIHEHTWLDIKKNSNLSFMQKLIIQSFVCRTWKKLKRKWSTHSKKGKVFYLVSLQHIH